MDLKSIAAMALDETNDDMNNMPPDLILHDKKYHHGHWDGKGACKYREDRKAALAGREEGLSEQDIIDRLTPEDVDGEEIDKVDMLEPTTAANAAEQSSADDAIAKLKAAGKAPNDLVAGILAAVLAKKDAKNVQPLLDKMAETLNWSVDNNDFDDARFDGAMTKLAELVKSGALNEALGLGKNTAKLPTPQNAKRIAELKTRQSNLQSDVDMLRTAMQLASPTAAAILQGQLDAIEKELKSVEAELSGKKPTATPSEEDEKAKRKAEKEAAKKAQKDATNAFKDKIANSEAPMPLSDTLEFGKTVALASPDFQTAFDAMPQDRKIYAYSDMHDSEWKKLGMSKCGTVMLSGDINDAFYSSPKYHEDTDTQIKRAQKWIDDTLEPFCKKHGDQQFVMCPGNHDNILALPEAKNLKWPSNVTMLNDTEAKVNGMRIYGTGICGRRAGMPESYFEGRPYELSDADYKTRADAIPEGLDVLLIHHPPKDDGYEGDATMGGGKKENNGVSYLAEVIKKKKPKLVICGHLHDGDHRPYKIGDSVIINAARVSNTSRNKGGYSHHDIGMTYPKYGNIGFFVDGEDNHIV